MRLRPGALLLFLMGAPSAVMGQEVVADTVRPTDGVVSGAHMKPYSAEFRLEITGPDDRPQPFGGWTDLLEIVDGREEGILRREVARFDSTGTMDLWRVHTVDATTLYPIITHQRFGPDLGLVTRFEVSETEVKAVVVQQMDTPAIIHISAMSEPAFDLSLWAVLLRGFPLAEGYAAVFPVQAITAATTQVFWETVRVTGRERVAVEQGRMVDAWVVETVVRPWTVWLTDEAPYIAKVIQRLPNGAEVTSIRVASEVPGSDPQGE